MIMMQLILGGVLAGMAGGLLARSGFGLLLLPAVGSALCFSRTWRVVGIGVLLTTGLGLLLLGICFSQLKL